MTEFAIDDTYWQGSTRAALSYPGKQICLRHVEMPDVPLLTGVQAMGWMIEMFPVVTVLLVSGWFLTQRQGKDDGGVFDGLFSPTKEWGPR